MTSKAIQTERLDDIAMMVDLSVKEANKVRIAALLFSIRKGVLQKASCLPPENPPVLIFDPRRQIPEAQ